MVQRQMLKTNVSKQTHSRHNGNNNRCQFIRKKLVLDHAAVELVLWSRNQLLRRFATTPNRKWQTKRGYIRFIRPCVHCAFSLFYSLKYGKMILLRPPFRKSVDHVYNLWGYLGHKLQIVAPSDAYIIINIITTSIWCLFVHKPYNDMLKMLFAFSHSPRSPSRNTSPLSPADAAVCTLAIECPLHKCAHLYVKLSDYPATHWAILYPILFPSPHLPLSRSQKLQSISNLTLYPLCIDCFNQRATWCEWAENQIYSSIMFHFSSYFTNVMCSVETLFAFELFLNISSVKFRIGQNQMPPNFQWNAIEILEFAQIGPSSSQFAYYNLYICAD